MDHFLYDGFLRFNDVDFSFCPIGQLERAREQVHEWSECWDSRDYLEQPIRDALKSQGLELDGYVRSRLEVSGIGSASLHCIVVADAGSCDGSRELVKVYLSIDDMTCHIERFRKEV